MNDNQMINANVLQLINTPTENAPTISRFVEEYFSDLVPDSNYFAHLVRYDVGGEMLPPLPAEVIARLPCAAVTSTPSALRQYRGRHHTHEARRGAHPTAS